MNFIIQKKSQFVAINCNMNNLLKPILFGVAVGDALGVPVEFKSRKYLTENPVITMLSFGTHDQPTGTWSDDTSLTLCLAETIVDGFDLQKLADKFAAWKDYNYWTPLGWVFDIGIGTRVAIEKLANGEQPELAGGFGENDNGNGSLMRILPLILLTKDLPIEKRFELIKKVSSVTHGHVRAVIACFYYLEFARYIIEGKEKFEIYKTLQIEVANFLNTIKIDQSEIDLFKRLLIEDISQIEEDQIQSSGYVLHALEASIWCLLTTNNYAEATLKAINLGKDTDTNGAITGGIAALLYGFENIPKKWITVLKRVEDINQLIHKYQSTQQEFETTITFQYLHSGITDCEGFTQETNNYDYSTTASISLTNSNGINTIAFNFTHPISRHEEAVEIALESNDNNNKFGYYHVSFDEVKFKDNIYHINGQLIFDPVTDESYHIFRLKLVLDKKQMECFNQSSIYIGQIPFD